MVHFEMGVSPFNSLPIEKVSAGEGNAVLSAACLADIGMSPGYDHFRILNVQYLYLLCELNKVLYF